mmetsp:Transcript_91841/g.163465  ORF Transcript_91841/g.163465 Transcript_91841/m.163465 type:complete len:209 (+) Transcript_91841:64-690(+)|eukprot:CAMPEP_0197665226 /NCGR_PEP_ID=MMETSP1338-20131121/59105_1 /TAXON_ID=43686 ORGANISM="Pelagodinium beii, Strain RCC1491" /NCGR_SAMPLE_ID=MMETSP1338 /ASSEMBLY_ACC=CAM_ASM_000754 /LENGTH=208 /DNA_ID=CAMNT_0043243999 /DNA_START=60 /DNA_END=686 /DNA_ORIENTATION=+
MERLYVGGLNGLKSMERADYAESEVSASDSEQRENLEMPSEGRVDLPGLLSFLENLSAQGARLVEAQHIVNRWVLGGFIPMTHHGFVFKASNMQHFSLDFSRKGIVWDTFGDQYPELPEGTLSSTVYRFNVDPCVVQNYCRDTKPFQWFSNDCDTWSKGLFQAIGVAYREKQLPLAQKLCGVSHVEATNTYAEIEDEQMNPTQIHDCF